MQYNQLELLFTIFLYNGNIELGGDYMNYKEYVIEHKIKDKTKEEEKKELMMSIIKTKIELENSRKNYGKVLNCTLNKK